MRALVQRVSSARVVVEENVVGAIGAGMLIFLGIAPDDGDIELEWIAQKCAQLRIFADEDAKMNRSVIDVGGGVLVVSQFTLYGDARKGNRPSFIGAAPPQHALPIYERFVATMRRLVGEEQVATGVFQAEMKVELVNDGPVTLLIEKEPSKAPA